jgi:general secretion pathway protein A
VRSVDGVSDDLLALFQSAIDDTEQDPQFKNSVNQAVEPEVNAPTLSDMPAWVQSELPSLNFQQHIYTSEGESWVNVNGRDRYEGDTISEKLVLNHIYSQKVILTFKGQQFSLPALSSW